MLEFLLMIVEVYCQYRSHVTLQSATEIACCFWFVYDCLCGFSWLSSQKWVASMVARIKEQLSQNYKVQNLEKKLGFSFDPFICVMLANLFNNQFSNPRSFSEYFDILILFLASDKLTDFLVATATAIYDAKKFDFERCDSLQEIDFVFKVRFFSGWQVNPNAISILKEVHHVNFIKLFK